MRSALALVAAAGVALGLEVHEPAHAAGVYAETRADFSPRGYRISGPVSVVEACPCDWLSKADYGSGYGPGSFVGLILVVPGDACSGCSAVEAACAATRACERQQEAYATDITRRLEQPLPKPRASHSTQTRPLIPTLTLSRRRTTARRRGCCCPTALVRTRATRRRRRPPRAWAPMAWMGIPRCPRPSSPPTPVRRWSTALRAAAAARSSAARS